jgi:Sulfotransferase domain
LYRLPDFFIVGAPKCGTTSLATYLGEHPAIFMSPVKEPNYFCLDAPTRRYVTAPDEYSVLFAPAARWQACGEASTSYLFSTEAVPAILEANPRANIIAMVRNPLEMVVSYHDQKVFSLQELELSFEAAWRLSPERARGRMIAMQGHAPRYLDYCAIGRLGEQIRRLKAWVPARQLHVIAFDDLRSEPRAVYRDALIFLGIRPDERHHFPVMNSRKRRVSRGLTAFVRSPPPPISWAKHAVQRAFPEHTRALGKRMKALNTRIMERKPLADWLRQEMVDAFRDDVALLGDLIDRDLSHWCMA